MKRIDRYREAVRESDLSSTEKHVALEMAEYMDHDSLASCHPGPARIARRTSLSERTVKRTIKALCSKGWLRQVHKGGSHPGQRRASIYMGTYPCHSVTGTRDTVSTDPCHSVTPPSQGPSQHQGGAGNERTATPLEGVDGASSGKNVVPIKHRSDCTCFDCTHPHVHCRDCRTRITRPIDIANGRCAKCRLATVEEAS